MISLCLTSAIEYQSLEGCDRLEGYIRSLAGGNIEAMEGLYRETSTAVFSFALSILKNRQDAEDVMHDAYVRIFSSAVSYTSAGKPMAWVLTIVKNLAFMKLRDRKKTGEIKDEEWANIPFESSELTSEDRLLLGDILGILQDEERTIVILHAVAGFKHREISSFLDMPIGTVLSKYRRALNKMNVHAGGGL